ncbi:MAG: CinA family protein [Clostridia bacterium]|nr:CinA family protein [Clostridia bacterium]
MTLEEEVISLLSEKGLTLTAAESCTGGLIAKRLTDVSGASAVFHGSLVTYSNRLKEKWLGVQADTLQTYGAVSAQTAREMALGARKAADADLAVAVTGIAGPNSDDTNKPVGLVFIALADRDSVTVEKYENQFTDNVREQNRTTSAQRALEAVRRYLFDGQ